MDNALKKEDKYVDSYAHDYFRSVKPDGLLANFSEYDYITHLLL